MDGNVRAVLKKVTVNEDSLSQAIQALGGGEKGLKELIGHIMLWVKQHNGEMDYGKTSLSQKLEKLHPPQMNHALEFASGKGISGTVYNPNLASEGYDQRNEKSPCPFVRVQSSEDLQDMNHLFQCIKSRRLMGEGGLDINFPRDVHSGSGTFVDVRGSVPDVLHFPSGGMGPRSPNHIGPAMLQGMPCELDIQRPLIPCAQAGLSFSGEHDGLSRIFTATTRAARRNQISRQRQSGLQSNSTFTPSNTVTAVSSECGLWSVAPPAWDMSVGVFLSRTQSPSCGPDISDPKMLTFLLQKELRPSDVGNLGRIILPKKEAEAHLPILALREGILLQMEDFDSGHCWKIRYRFWPNNKSRMYLLENTGEFVKSHRLEEGDLLVLYKIQEGNYVLRAQKKVHSESSGAPGSQQKNAYSLARDFPEASKTEEPLKEKDIVGFAEWSCGKVNEERNILVRDDDPFFKDDQKHKISSSFSPEPLQSLERFPSLSIDFPLDEMMPWDDPDEFNTDSELAELVG
ncbi:B3 domain-containing protein VP1 [Physcomitrium patens]|uniref:TF-B3 domain-containing protein n=1 Tax=Physcomitrium patens TaxID=3218 RepID=A0A2K1J469_PHYPA|nr:B3 domain-containing protein VP1-like [Physcomitrium patens]PNR36327.1 hypothetical protein PHYPA_022178 [Physcomitrium patens]|eukprot:XP_024401493.1 B3 domain-containing protein VP1-like [Physcomitrella patens]